MRDGLWIFTVAAALSSASVVSAATETLPTPELFAPGVISAGTNDGAPTFSNDGRTIFFERTNSKLTAILESHKTKRGWSRPALAEFSGTASDQQPSFSPDGRHIVFVSARPGPDGKFASHIYRVDRTSTGWSAPAALPPEVNISGRIFKPSVAANGDVFFMSDVGKGGPPVWRLFSSRSEGSGYQTAAQLDFTQNGDVDPCIAPDQSYIVFSSNSRGGEADHNEHLYLARRSARGWSTPVRLRYEGDDWGGDDGEAQISPDGARLYFTSSRVVPVGRIHDRKTALEAIRRMNSWDNSNGNAWSLPLGPYLHPST